MLKRNFNNMVFDELFCYEWSKCQFRAIAFSSKNYIRTIFEPAKKKTVKYSNKAYCSYGETLEYIILKKIYFYMINKLSKGKPVSLDDFKNFSAIIMEKEILLNKKKIDKGNEHYNKIRKNITSNLEKHFMTINVHDFENIVEACVSVKVDLKEYLTMRLKSIRSFLTTSMPKFEWNGIPYFKLDILSISQVDELNCNLIVTSIFDLEEEYMHRNFILNMLFNYFYHLYEKDEDFLKNFSTKTPSFKKIIIYNPLTFTRKEVEFWEIACIFQESNLMKMLKIYIENIEVRSLDHRNCYTCENKTLCTMKARTPNKIAYEKEFLRQNKKNIDVIV